LPILTTNGIIKLQIIRLILGEYMKAYFARQRIGIGGGEFEGGMQINSNNPYELLDRTYATADTSSFKNGVQLTHAINNPDRPICVAMTQNEVRRIVSEGWEGRQKDMNTWLDSLDDDTLVVLEPYGHDLKPSKRNTKYLPDLAESGEEFPEIENSNTWPNMFGKSGGEITKITPFHDHFDAIVESLNGN
jgi:hypothetical protein